MSEIIDRIKDVLAEVPDGLTSAEIAERVGGTSYTIGSKLSKLGIYGELAREKIDRRRYRYKLPQRLSPLAKPGELLKRVTVAAATPSPHETVAEHILASHYLAMIRQLPCLKCGMEPCGEAAHVRFSSGAHGKHSGIGKKPDDKYAAPLCGWCHREDRDSQHHVGEKLFWGQLGINPVLVCERLYPARGDLVRMRAIILTAIAERQR